MNTLVTKFEKIGARLKFASARGGRRSPDFNVDVSWYLIKNEPLMRGRGKPHMAEYVYRTGGRTVYVNSSYPRGVTEAAYKTIIQNPQNKGMIFTARRLAPTVYVKGKITHPDHKTIVLDYWHRVVPNTEKRAASMKYMAFID